MSSLILFLFFVWSQIVVAQSEDKPVAKVGKYTIMLSKFRERYHPSGDVNRDSLKQMILDDLICDKLMLIDAYAKGLDTIVESQLKPDMNRILVGKLYESAVVKQAKVSPWDVRNEWWHRGVTLKLSQISVKDKSGLRNVYNELRAGVDFAEVARRYSTDYQGKYGGDIGEIRWGQLDPKLQRVAFSLKEGEVSRPVKINDEYRILKLHERKEVKGRNFVTEKDMIEGDLKRKRQVELANKYLEHLRGMACIKYNMDVIEEVSKCRDSVTVDKDKVLLSWIGGKITVGYFAERADMELKMGRLPTPEAIKNWLLNHLTFEFLLPRAAARHHFERLPEVKKQLAERRETMMLREYQTREIDSKISITDEELRARFESHRVDYGGKAAKFEQMQSRVRWDLEREKKQLRREELVRDLKSRVAVDVFWDNLKEL